MRDFFKDLNTPRKGIIHLTMFWRVILFPIIFIWWFLFQLFAFSLFGGMFIVIIGLSTMIGAFATSDWAEDFVEGLGFILLPFIAPFTWLYKYFVLGEFNTLFEE